MVHLDGESAVFPIPDSFMADFSRPCFTAQQKLSVSAQHAIGCGAGRHVATQKEQQVGTYAREFRNASRSESRQGNALLVPGVERESKLHVGLRQQSDLSLV